METRKVKEMGVANMYIKKHAGSIIGILLVIAAIFMVLPFNVFAGVNPWEAYDEYIPVETPVIKRHLRGTWISTVLNLDWPSAETRNMENDVERIQKSKEELAAILDNAVQMKMNAVFFQVSPEGDAFYKSSVVPWSRYLTGTFGKDPGFDPLSFAIEEAHKRNLEIHAWFNPYRVSMNMRDDTRESLRIEKSVYSEHPEWIKSSMGRFVVDPGIPGARKWVIDRVTEIVSNYDVDGVHFDDYFYYESYEGELKDGDTFTEYNEAGFGNIGDWRRNNTYLLVRELSDRLRSKTPWIKFGISPGGVWGNIKDGHPDGSNTDTTFTNYGKSFADTKRWVEEELLDYIAPQIYFTFANTRVPYGELAAWWAEVCREKNVHLYIGQALYKINDDTDQYFKGENALPEFACQIKFNAVKPEIMGSIMFRAQNFNNEGKMQVVNAMKDELWSTTALVPVMQWKGGKAPDASVLGKMDVFHDRIELSWTDNDSSTAYYAVYRFDKDEEIDIASDRSAINLIGTVRKKDNGRQVFTDTNADSPENTLYVVANLDRLHNESNGLVISLSRSNYFPDISSGYSWAVKSIDNLYERGIIEKDSHGMFYPGCSAKRGEVILMLVRALNLKADFIKNFNDVENGSYYYNAIGIARELGIAKGDGELFYPNAEVTREDMMVLLDRALEKTGIYLEKGDKEYLKGFKDAELISSYAVDAVAGFTKAGLIKGSNGEVNPKGVVTRAEIAVILDRILMMQKEG